MSAIVNVGVSAESFWSLTPAQTYFLFKKNLSKKYESSSLLASFYADFINVNSKRGTKKYQAYHIIGHHPESGINSFKQVSGNELVKHFKIIFPEKKKV